MWLYNKMTQHVRGVREREAFSEEVTLEPRAQGWVRADQASEGQGGREEEFAFAECQRMTESWKN